MYQETIASAPEGLQRDVDKLSNYFVESIKPQIAGEVKGRSQSQLGTNARWAGTLGHYDTPVNVGDASPAAP